jgi:flagellar biosynthesis protein FlhG
MAKNSQAAGMVCYQDRRPVKVVAVSSGKGGVGKTNVATNIAVALAARQRNVILLDADLSLANVDVLLGLQPLFNLSHVIKGEVDLESTLVSGPCGLRIVPASSGSFAMTDLPAASHATIINSFSDLSSQPDVLIVDTAAGISDNVARFVHAAQEAIIVVCDEPSSITDAYALIKVFSRNYGITRYQIVTNQTCSEFDGKKLFAKINRVADLYLDVVLHHLGNITYDGYLRRSVQEQRAVVEAYPKSASGRAFRQIARKLEALPLRPDSSRGIQFFFERLLNNRRPCSGRTA